ncbi:hypothetical protein V1291_000004 [Nitrobacteraceae bacterium AZCC 1564]
MSNNFPATSVVVATVHELKCTPQYFRALESGVKPFEIRRDDRSFQRGDILQLNEWDYNRSPVESMKYTGRSLIRRITYILTNHDGLAPGFVILGLEAPQP